MRFLSIYGRSIIGYLCSSFSLFLIPIIFAIFGNVPVPQHGWDFTGAAIIFIIICVVIFAMVYEILIIALLQSSILYIAQEWNKSISKYYDYFSAIIIGIIYNVSIIIGSIFLILNDSAEEWWTIFLLLNLLPVVILVLGYILYTRHCAEKENL